MAALSTHLIVDLRAVDLERPDEAGEYALQLTEALVDQAVHHEVTVLEPGFRGGPPAGDVLLLPAGGRPVPGYRCVTAIHRLDAVSGFRARFRTAFAASRSDLVIAPSEAVGAALTGYLRVPVEQVAVIPPGLGPGFGRTTKEASEAVRSRFQLPPRYLLAFGDAGAARAAWAAATVPAEAGLVLAGDLRAAREDLPALLSGAVAVLFAEPAAGNPIRALMAMACGSPPIVTDDAAFPEVVRDGGLTIATGSGELVVEAISAVYRSRSLRAQLSARARELAADLTARRAARRLIELLGRQAGGDVGQRKDPRDLDR